MPPTSFLQFYRHLPPTRLQSPSPFVQLAVYASRGRDTAVMQSPCMTWKSNQEIQEAPGRSNQWPISRRLLIAHVY